ncbi:MAG: spore coat protein U domain-containing protein [Betaproteobacteria bacterium]
MHTWQRQKRTGDRFAMATALFMVLLTSAVPTRAATATAPLLVQARVEVLCGVATTANVNFGTLISPFEGERHGIGEFTLNGFCSFLFIPPPRVSLSVGNGVGATFAARKMSSTSDPSKTITYSLHLEALNGPLWGDGTNGSEQLIAYSLGSHIIYGVIPSGQSPPEGVYSDTVVITVTF